MRQRPINSCATVTPCHHVFDLHSALLSCKITFANSSRTPKKHQGRQVYSHHLPERPLMFRRPRATLSLRWVAMPQAWWTGVPRLRRPSRPLAVMVGLATRPVECPYWQGSIRPIIPYHAHIFALRLYARSDTAKLVVRVQLFDRRQREYHA